MKAQFYLSIVPQITDSFSDVLVVAKRAEELGYSGLGIGEHYPTSERPTWRPDPFVTLAALSQVPNMKIKFGTLALSATTRHPVVLANSAVTLHNISGERFFLCLGVGSGNDDEYSLNGFPHVQIGDRLQALEETLAIIRGLRSRRDNGHDSNFTWQGQYYKLRGAKIFGKEGFPPIWIGERNSTRILKLGGRYSDAINIHCNSPEHAMKKLDFARKSAVESGREKADVQAVIKHFVILGKDDEIVSEKLGYSQSKLEGENRSSFVEREIKENPDAIIGTPDRVKSRYESYVEAGFEKFTPVLLPNTLDQIVEGMELFARTIIT